MIAHPDLVVFDVDGTLRWTVTPGRRYPVTRAEWRLMPNVERTLRALPWRPGGAWLAVASNQDGVPLGEITAQDARGLIEATLAAALGTLPEDAVIEMCVHPHADGCACRKPAPGMLQRILERTGVPAARALFVGDLDIDREAARRAGMPFRWAHEFFGWRRRE